MSNDGQVTEHCADCGHTLHSFLCHATVVSRGATRACKCETRLAPAAAPRIEPASVMRLSTDTKQVNNRPDDASLCGAMFTWRPCCDEQRRQFTEACDMPAGHPFAHGAKHKHTPASAPRDAEARDACVACNNLGGTHTCDAPGSPGRVLQRYREEKAEHARLAAEVEALRSQLADKTRQLTELSTADGTSRWVAGKELEMIEALRGQVARLDAFAEEVRANFKCKHDECDSNPAICPCGGDDCWRCAAAQALNPPPWRLTSASTAPAGETT